MTRCHIKAFLALPLSFLSLVPSPVPGYFNRKNRLKWSQAEWSSNLDFSEASLGVVVLEVLPVFQLCVFFSVRYCVCKRASWRHEHCDKGRAAKRGPAGSDQVPSGCWAQIYIPLAKSGQGFRFLDVY